LREKASGIKLFIKKRSSMKCTARKHRTTPTDAASFIRTLFNSSPCEEEAAYLGPDNQPLCEPCALERKRAHEEGATIAAIYQKEKLGAVLEYQLRRIQ